MTYRNCKGLCVIGKYKKRYDTSRGLPPTVKNRLEKKKCRRCGIWMRVNNWRCFCCNQQLTQKRRKQPTMSNRWRNEYPTFEVLKMIPIHVEMVLNKL